MSACFQAVTISLPEPGLAAFEDAQRLRDVVGRAQRHDGDAALLALSGGSLARMRAIVPSPPASTTQVAGVCEHGIVSAGSCGCNGG